MVLDREASESRLWGEDILVSGLKDEKEPVAQRPVESLANEKSLRPE